MLGIAVSDHVIIGEGRYYSFKERHELRTGLSRQPLLAVA